MVKGKRNKRSSHKKRPWWRNLPGHQQGVWSRICRSKSVLAGLNTRTQVLREEIEEMQKEV